MLVIFASLYSNINPIFEKWVAAIDLSFINITWLLFTGMGYILLRNISSKASLDILTNIYREAPQNLVKKPTSEAQESLLHKEQLLGSMVIGVLNALILFFLIVDIWYVTTNTFQPASELSRTVPEGVNALITSILIAITLILILFRGNLNFYKNSKRLRILTYIWIILNGVLVIVTTFKNYIYITDFGLTYKRIGVIIYLTLCIVGLCTTYFKVAQRKNVLYLVRINARIAFFIIILMSSFSWNREITRYNLSHVKRPDLPYLESMGGNNIDLLYAFAKAYPEKFSTESHFHIQEKYDTYMKTLNDQTWQSKTLAGIKTSASVDSKTHNDEK
jgi:magnesium-transporting ATPase (P-type)